MNAHTTQAPAIYKATQTKHVYQTPVIQQFGDIRALTLSFGKNGNSDGATTGGNRQTQA